MGAPKPVEYTPEGLFRQSCMDCLMQKAAAGDKQAKRALHFLACLSEFMACRMLSGRGIDRCDQRNVKPLPAPVQPLFDMFDCSKVRINGGDKLMLLVSGTAHAIIEDEDWDRRGTGSP